MKHWAKLAVALAVVALLVGVLFVVAYAEQGAAPSVQTATATPAPKAEVVVDTANPVVPALKDWQASPHADAKAMAFRHWDETDPQAVPATCAKCHSSGGYQDFLGADGSAAGKVDKPAAVNTVIDCVACHNTGHHRQDQRHLPVGRRAHEPGRRIPLYGMPPGPRVQAQRGQTDHRHLQAHRQRTEDTVVKPLVTTDATGKTVTTTFGFRNVHYFAAAATQYGTLVKGGYEYDGQSLRRQVPASGAVRHLQRLPQPAHARTRTSKHAPPAMTGVKTVEDLAKIRMNGSLVDYDGDGDAKEGIEAEMAGLQEKLLAAIKAYAKEVAKADIVYDPAAYPYFFADKNGNGKVDDGREVPTAPGPRAC